MLALFLLFSSLWAGVQPLDKAPLRKHLKGAEISFLAHPSQHGNKQAFMGYLKLPAGGKVPLHQDATEEYLYILQGQGSLWINGKKIGIKANDAVFMPAGAEVRFENGPQELLALQFFAGPGPEKKYNAKAWKPAPSVK